MTDAETIKAIAAITASTGSNSDPDLMGQALDRIDALVNGRADPGPPDVSDEHRAELEAVGFEVTESAGRFYAYDEGMEFGPNPGYDTEAAAWRACAVRSDLFTCYGQ